MLTDEEWNEIHYDLIGGGFFDCEERPKTLKAVRRVVERMSVGELDTLQGRVSIVFAPAPGKQGEIYPFLNSLISVGQELHSTMVYLSPELERRNQRYVISVVAHEFAHVLLHSFDSPAAPSIEREADEKVRSWGLEPAYRDEDYPD